MNGFRKWFARYMIGRYGNDELNRFLLIVSAILIVIGIFVPRHILNLAVVILLIIVYQVHRRPGQQYSRPELWKCKAPQETEACPGQEDLHLPELQRQSAGPRRRRTHPDPLPALRQ